MVVLKVAAARSRAARPAVGDPVVGAAAFPADPQVAAAPEAAVAQFRAARPALEAPAAEAAAFLAVRPAAAVPAAAEVVCPAWGASRCLDPRADVSAIPVREQRSRTGTYARASDGVASPRTRRCI